MIDLTPNHKQALSLAHPVILSAGTASYGEALPPGFNPSHLGAVVLGPVSAQSRSGPHGPRLAQMPGSLVLDHGGQNRGIEAAIRRFAHLWQPLPCAVIIQIIDNERHALEETIHALNQADGVDAIELLIPDIASTKQVRSLIEHALAYTDVPLLVKLPIARATRLAQIAVDAGARTLVLGEPGMAALPTGVASIPTTPIVQGRFYSPANFPVMLRELIAVRKGHPDIPIIATGGIHSPQMARQALDLGAQAVALDSVVWLDPYLAATIAASFAGIDSLKRP